MECRPTKFTLPKFCDSFHRLFFKVRLTRFDTDVGDADEKIDKIVDFETSSYLIEMDIAGT
jgi:hypothetical protein